MTRTVLIILAALLAVSCERLDFIGMIHCQSASVDSRFESSMAYLEKKGIQDIVVGSDCYDFNALSDIHATTDFSGLTRYLRRSIDESTESTAPFFLCIGDIIDGHNHHKGARDAIAPVIDAGWQFFTALGNHDILFGEWEQFLQCWNTSIYYFNVMTPSAGTDMFLCLDSAEGTLGKKQTKWLEKILSGIDRSKYRHITVFTHTDFYSFEHCLSMSSNFPKEEGYYLMDLLSKNKIDCVICGHNHYFQEFNWRGTRFLTLGAFLTNENDGNAYLMSYGNDISIKEIGR